MFVAMSCFRIANGMADAVREAFRNRPRLVEAAAGFLRMDVLGTLETPVEIRLITYWADEASYRAWHRSAAYRESQAAIPRGLKLAPGSITVEFYEHITS